MPSDDLKFSSLCSESIYMLLPSLLFSILSLKIFFLVLHILLQNDCMNIYTEVKRKLNTESLYCEADSCSSCQEIIRILWKPNIHYRVHKNLPLDSILCQMSPVLAIALQ
jgi:hypothetical protein